ncbi:MAG TPA: ABC transporter substrate-binding protein [Terrimesophilobacter sp.]|nr:ABC transporter substrate-binding protein [Terrimesophilobacter sp.]
MSRIPRSSQLGLGALALAAAIVVSGCGTTDPLAPPSEPSADSSIVVGSQAYYSNDIIAELYAQVLEDAGYTVERRFQIGQRDAYIPALESGEVNVFPEYTGNLLQYFNPDATSTDAASVYSELTDALPDSLVALDYADAEDRDSYNVTQEFSDQYGVTSLADLASVPVTITVGGNPELAERPYGPKGLLEFYGVEVEFVAIGDSAGPLTKAAITDGTITMGDLYSADPDIAASGFVTLDDPQGMFLAQNVVPIVSADLANELASLLGAVSAQLTTDELVGLNLRSTAEQLSPSVIAKDWLTEKGLLD